MLIEKGEQLPVNNSNAANALGYTMTYLSIAY